MDTTENTESSAAISIMKNIAAVREQNIFCDFKLIVDGEEFPVHRVIMAACSNTFRNMMIENTSNNQMTLQDVSKHELQVLIDFAYSGKLEVTVDNVLYIMSLLDKYKMTEAFKLCCNFMLSNNLNLTTD